jgi:amino acid transporter
LSLADTVALGTGIMIGAGIFALAGQIAGLAGGLSPIAFIVGAIISGFRACGSVKVSDVYSSAGGIAMILRRAYGGTTVTGTTALLMAFSMIISEASSPAPSSTYTLQLFPPDIGNYWVPVLAVAFFINLSGIEIIGPVADVTAAIKIGGLLAFAAIALAASGVAMKTSCFVFMVFPCRNRPVAAGRVQMRI